MPQALQRTLPDANQQGNVRIFRKAAVQFRMFDIVQYVNHMSAADSWRIVYARFAVRRVFVELLDAVPGQLRHVLLASKVQTASGAGLDASRFQPRAHAI